MTVARSEMHDRINLVIQSRVPNLDGVNLCDLVDGILLAMREPTEAMLNAGDDAQIWTLGDDPSQRDILETGWPAMIDAALSPSAQDPR